jgi:hypothetical protein
MHRARCGRNWTARCGAHSGCGGRGWAAAFRCWHRSGHAYGTDAEQQETDWDSAEDCLVTHGPPGVLNLTTGVCGLAAMLWLYAVAWHLPMAQTLDWAQARVLQSLPATETLLPGGIGTALQGMTQRSAPAAAGTISTRPRSAPGNADELTTDLAAQFSARAHAAVDEGLRQLRAGNPRRAMELCRAWTDLELANADAWRCLGQAAQAAGAHQEAVNAFRKAKQFDPADQTLDGAIERSQQGIVADFLRRNRP